MTYVSGLIRASLRLSFLIVVALSASNTYAAASGWTEHSKVTQIVVTAGGGVNVKLSPELSGCVSQSGYGEKYASVYSTHPGLQAIHANLLAAYMAGKDVRLWFSDDTCKVGEMRIGE